MNFKRRHRKRGAVVRCCGQCIARSRRYARRRVETRQERVAALSYAEQVHPSNDDFDLDLECDGGASRPICGDVTEAER